ncbi:unnamed protein product, partial [Rhizoctonia solani]
MSLASGLVNRVRLRISEIELQPTISNRFIKGELRIGGKVVKELPAISSGQVLKWSNLIIWQANYRHSKCDLWVDPFILSDTRPDSRVDLAMYERRHGIYSRYESQSCLVSEMMESPTKILTISTGDRQHIAAIKLLDRTQIDARFARGFEKLGKIGQTNQTASRLTAARRVFISMLEFGRVVADAHPIAKTVFSVCICAWEGLEAQGKCGEELNDLVGRLAGMGSLVDAVKPHIHQEHLQQTIGDFLNLIEDVSIFVTQQEAGGLVARKLQSLIDSGAQDRVWGYTKRFKAISEEFRTAIGVQAIAMVATAHEQEILKRLNHVEPSGHDPSLACQEGTRLGVLGDIDEWIHSSE